MKAKIRLSYVAGDPIPKSLGVCADHFKAVQALRLLMQKDIDVVKKREKELEDHLIDSLSASDDTGVSGKKFHAKVTSKKQPTADDWEKIHDWVYENDRFDILGKSLNSKAVNELWEDDKIIPGVKGVNVKKLSVTKVK